MTLNQEADLYAVCVCEAIRVARIKRGMTQSELAKKAKIGRVTLSAIENGHSSIRIKSLLRISMGLGISSIAIVEQAVVMMEEKKAGKKKK
jgi:transcriptional regulator with XRE-family HTH domain